MFNISTSTVTVSISPDLHAAFPDTCIAGFVTDLSDITDLPVNANVPDGITIANISDHPNIVGWRNAMSACGLKPSTFKSSAEQLIRRTIKNGPVQTGLPVVDAYCGASVRHIAPLGAYDLGRLPLPEISLRFADADDTFDPLGGDTKMVLNDNVAVYASGNTVCCYGWNHRDSRATCLQPDSSRVIFLGEAVTAPQKTSLLEAMEDLRSLVQGGQIFVVDAAAPAVAVYVPGEGTS